MRAMLLPISTTRPVFGGGGLFEGGGALPPGGQCEGKGRGKAF